VHLGAVLALLFMEEVVEVLEGSLLVALRQMEGTE
jgi:hypothetical protein